MQTYKIPEASWPAELRAILQDKALDVFLQLPLAYANTYQKIKLAMLRHWGISTQSKVQEVLEMNPKSHNTAVQAHAHILEAFKALATGKNLNQFMDSLALEMVHKMAAPHISSLVHQLRLPNSDQALASMDDYVSDRQLDPSRLWKQSSYLQRPPQSLQKPQLRFSDLASQSPTSSSTLPSSDKSPSNSITANKPQHKLAKYFDPSKGPLCFNCQQWGHQAKDCPNRTTVSAVIADDRDGRIFCIGTLNQQLIRILVGEGAQVSMGNASLVSPPAPDSPLITVTCPWGNQQSLPSADINVTVMGQDLLIPALVCPTLNCDLILGLNCKQFYDIRQSAIANPFQMGAITRQQARLNLQDRCQQIADQQTDGLSATPLCDILGPDYDFPQSNLSIDQSISDLPPPTESTSDAVSIAKDQKDDPTLRGLFSQANSSNDSEFVICKDILHRKTTDKDGTPYFQVVLPKNRRQQILRIAHSTPMAGHTGSKATKHKIMRNFFWPNMSTDIKAYCQSCVPCQKTAKKTLPQAPLQTTPTFTTPFARVALDVVGPLPLTDRKHMYVLTYIDMATRYPDAVPLKTTTSKAVATVILEIFCRLSIPDEILTDRGSNFVSTFMREVYHFLGIKHLKTSPYRPQTNGCLEKYHHTLMQMVRKSVTDKKDWDLYLPYLLFACRETPSSATGYSPFHLLYGKHVHGPLDVLRNQWAPTAKNIQNAMEWLEGLRTMLDAMHSSAAEAQTHQKEYSKIYYDKQDNPRAFNPGDKVLIFSPVVTGKRSDKLTDRWQGPFTVLKKITPVTYTVDMPEHHKRKRSVHVNGMKKWIQPVYSLSSIACDPAESIVLPDYHQESN